VSAIESPAAARLTQAHSSTRQRWRLAEPWLQGSADDTPANTVFAADIRLRRTTQRAQSYIV